MFKIKKIVFAAVLGLTLSGSMAFADEKTETVTAVTSPVLTDLSLINLYETGSIYYSLGEGSISSYPVSVVSVSENKGLEENMVSVVLGGPSYLHRWTYTFKVNGWPSKAHIFTNDDGSASVRLLVEGALRKDGSLSIGGSSEFRIDIARDADSDIGYSKNAVLTVPAPID